LIVDLPHTALRAVIKKLSNLNSNERQRNERDLILVYGVDASSFSKAAPNISNMS
jgi:hypothetical protein